MDDLPRDVIEARLHLDEQLDALLSAGDYRTALRTIELVREDLRLFARHARKVAAHNGDELRRSQKRRVADQFDASLHARIEGEARWVAAGCENVTFLVDRR